MDGEAQAGARQLLFYGMTTDTHPRRAFLAVRVVPDGSGACVACGDEVFRYVVTAARRSRPLPRGECSVAGREGVDDPSNAVS